MKLFKFKTWHTTVLMICLLVTSLTFMTGAVTPNSGYSAGKYALELDGAIVGWLDSAEGGNATADVIVEAADLNKIQKKHLAGVKYEDISITTGTNMSKAFYQWIKASLEGDYSHKNGAIIAVDNQGLEVSRVTFTKALISEVTFPALDAASKDAAKISVKIKPGFTHRLVGKGSAINLPKSDSSKQLRTSNFRLKIDGLEQATIRANKIPALTVKLNVVDHAIGEVRDLRTDSGKIVSPNLVFSLTESHSQPLYDWLEDFVIRGNSSDSKEKNGILEYLTPNLQEALFTLSFNNLGIFNLSSESNENVRYVTAELYNERILFNFSDSLVRN